MTGQSGTDVKKAIKLVRDAANKKFGKDWSLVISNDGELQIEGRHMSGKIVQSIVWVNGRVESRTMVAKG